jgi:putative DNA primase/helicase
VDKCRDPETGEIAEWAWRIIETINSYTEVSPSGKGIHIIVYGSKPESAKSRFLLEGHEIEVYDQNQYITYSGYVVDLYDIIRNAQDWIDENVPLAKANLDQKNTITNEDLAKEVPELELSDEEIVRKLSSFSYGEKFKRLFSGDFEDYESHS